ncbi:ovochymase-2-like [Porites lutea]|uniref:ovochymase-2-like n=1 Tax=Porites lutea TaxID=51062 RepID=UPI003CC52F07
MPNCPEDSLEIIVGCGNLKRSLGKFCSCSNLSMPDKIYTYDNCLTLVFKSDGSNAGLGFLATYTTTDNNVTRLDPNNNCSSNDLVTSSHGTIFSPFWPLKYYPRADCRWQFSPPLGKIVRLFFTSVEFEEQNSCPIPKPSGFDDLGILYGTNTTGYEFQNVRVCFLPLVPFVLKNMTAIGFNFSSDGDGIVGTGFMAGYATYEGKVDPGCLMPPTEVPANTTGSTNIIKTAEAPTTGTKASAKPTAGTKKGLSGGEIAGISIGGLVGFIVLIVILICCTKHCCCKKTTKSADIKHGIPL